jgi:hypothetical protein
MPSPFKSIAVLAIAASLLAGCAESPESGDESATTQATAAPDAAYLMTEKPADAQGVGAARESVKDAEEVTLVGRVGGSREPFVDGLAAFTIVDPQVPHCAPDEGCPTPWDYCCTQDQVKDNIATVKVVGADGKPVAKDAKGLLGVKELDTIIVRGKARRDDAGNLVVLAEKVYVENR